ncbi:hypothetical protein [Brevibacterium sp. RIT 803]|uniref:hypothetical protein n=1 Tax=Brevibacterium sp. RIT 803 TaxID=2810210 RepID=UPI001950E35D|nr:hypothetical protein [Brevibacterium sp. RIT 803]MBM6589082.1 hypothetical protein [Brevibacterium sp. RIT 803]
MYNVVYFRDLRAAGATTTLIRSSLGCCLLKLCRGVYSVVRRCGVPAHSVFLIFAENDEWIRYHEEGTYLERSQRPKYLEHLDRLRVLTYPSYRDGDVVWGVSAARLHQLGMFGIDSQPISVINPRAGSRSGELVRRQRRIIGGDVEILDGVAVTNRARTALDLIGVLGPAGGFAAMEQVLRASMLGDDEEAAFRRGYPPDLMDHLPENVSELFGPARARMAVGRKRALTLCGLVSPLSESYAESRASLNLHLLGLHDFIQQFDVKEGYRTLTRLDFLFKAAKVALYVDGTQKYVAAGFDRMNKESHQHNRLLSMGYTVIRFKFNEVLDVATFSRKLFAQAPQLKKSCQKKTAI